MRRRKVKRKWLKRNGGIKKSSFFYKKLFLFENCLQKNKNINEKSDFSLFFLKKSHENRYWPWKTRRSMWHRF